MTEPNQGPTTTGRLARRLALFAATAAGLLAAPAIAQTDTDTEDKPLVVPETLKQAPVDRLATFEEQTLTEVLGRLNTAPGANRSVIDSVEAVRMSLAHREAMRAEAIDEASNDLDTHLEEFETKPTPQERDLALSEGLQAAARIKEIAADPATFEADARIRRLIAAAERAAHKAEERGDWLLANELFFRLNVLFDEDRRFMEDVKRLSDKLGMIRLYNPERFWELGNERRQLSGDDPAPPYNPLGDGYEEKLDPIEADMVLRAIFRGATGQVDRDDDTLRDMLVGALKSVRNMTNNEDLYEVFPGLNDARQRQEFLSMIEQQIRSAERPDRRVSIEDARQAMNRVLSVNRFTVRVMPQALLHEFGDGAMAELDDYTAVIWPDEIKQFERSTKGEFVGVGVQIQLDESQNIKVVTPLEGTPAQRAGVRADDVIIKVDGKSTIGFTLDQAVEVITGPRNTPVTLTVERGDDEDKEEIDFRIVRNTIELPTVKGWRKVEAGDTPDAWDWFIDEGAGVGYIRLTNFSEKTTRDFDAAVAEMRRNGLNSLVLDLRFNPGGLLDQAVSISSRFVPGERLVVKTEDGVGRVTDRQRAQNIPRSKRLDDIPVVVLVNEGSASASEIVSGAIQAHSLNAEIDPGPLRAWIVGENSFGKGSVQNVFGLDRQGKSAMKLTTQYYKLKGDRTIHRKPGLTEWGIQPDVTVSMLPEQIVESVRLRQNADILPLDEQGNVIADAERPDPSELLAPGKDLQLQAALALLKGETASPGVALREDRNRRIR